MTTTAANQLATELGDLVDLPGPAGAEEAVAASITAELAGLSMAPSRDNLGNVRLAAGGPHPRVLITAHMDQVGYMVSRVEATQAHCLRLGSPQLAESQTASVRVLGEDHEVFAGALESLGDEGGVLRCDRLDEVRVGDRVVFANALEMRNDARVCGPALDDRIGCLIALHAARILADDESEVAFAWTVREETGPAGVIRVARDLNPEVVVAVDITYATASDQTTESAVAVGQGPVITLLDGGMVGHSWPVRAFDRAASSLGLRWQPEVVRGGVSEAGRAERMLGLPALALLVAIENPHSHDEIADLNDIASVRDLLVAGVRELIHGSRQ